MRLADLCLLPTSVALVVGLWCAPAQACSPPPTPRLYYTFAESHPALEQRLFVDGAVLLGSRAWFTEGEFAESFQEVLTVTVSDAETGVTVPGTLTAWWGATPGVAWKPEASLLPDRRYTLVAMLGQSAPRPGDAEGSTELRRTFTTSDQVAPPLELLGMAKVELEEFETDELDCSQADGMCACEKVGRETSTSAHIQLPGIRGGAIEGLYRVELWVTDGTPYRFGAPDQHLEHEVLSGSWGRDSSGLPFETFFEMPRNDAPYVPCFAYRVVDVAGNVREGTPVCMREEIDPPGAEGGCAAGPAQGRSLGAAGLLLVGAGLLRSRRRRCNAG